MEEFFRQMGIPVPDYFICLSITAIQATLVEWVLPLRPGAAASATWCISALHELKRCPGSDTAQCGAAASCAVAERGGRARASRVRGQDPKIIGPDVPGEVIAQASDSERLWARG